MNEQIQHLHGLFCRLTGVQLRLGIGEYNREASWFAYVKAGFTGEDLALVIRYLQKQIREGARNPGSLRFSNLIDRLDLYEETLCMARAAARVKSETPKQRVIAMRERPVCQCSLSDTQNTSKPIGDYIAQLRKAAE